jgi:general secretion pathway protein I
MANGLHAAPTDHGAQSGARPRGFTLLEVLVAVAILAIGLTAVLSAQTGLFASSSRTGRLSAAVGLVRCRMNEIEARLLRDGFPLIDESEEGLCCEDEDSREFTCSWKVERVELPQPLDLQEADLGDSTSSPGESLGPLGALAAVEQSKGAALGDDPSLGGLADLMGGATAGGTQAMAPLVMSLVYPTLKPMLEASIRRVTVTASWKEGSIDRDLSVAQFLTNPQQGGLDPFAAAGLQVPDDTLPGSSAPQDTGGSRGPTR